MAVVALSAVVVARSAACPRATVLDVVLVAAAGLAAVSVLLIGLSLWTARQGRTPSRPPMVIAALRITGVGVAGMVAGGTHVHAAGASGHHADAAGHDDHGL